MCIFDTTLKKVDSDKERVKRKLRKKCPYLELFWSVISRIRTEYGEIIRISPYSIRMRANTDQNNYDYGHFLRSVKRKSKISNLPHYDFSKLSLASSQSGSSEKN